MASREDELRNCVENSQQKHWSHLPLCWKL
uniref:Constitutive androstane receptor SV2 n=1 Tax=Homo sapiens TaxID=9606 RepID=Q6GZ88_HUMAN|nr:constitutive androstane receptor SV2 [Homo sapiens]